MKEGNKSEVKQTRVGGVDQEKMIVTEYKNTEVHQKEMERNIFKMHQKKVMISFKRILLVWQFGKNW